MHGFQCECNVRVSRIGWREAMSRVRVLPATTLVVEVTMAVLVVVAVVVEMGAVVIIFRRQICCRSLSSMPAAWVLST